MSSEFGENYRLITFGESHGKAVGVVMDNIKPGLPLTDADIQKELDRRRPGQSKVTTPRKESDTIEILSGVFEGKTTGAPICMLVWNKDADSSKYEKLKSLFRPGHADYVFQQKYGIRDYRGGGRSSGRETIARVAAGAIAKKMLASKGISITAYTKRIKDIEISSVDLSVIEKNTVRAPDMDAAKKMEDLIMSVKKQGNSVGGVIEVVIQGIPAGLGDPVFDKIDADLAKAIISIGTIKGVEIGNGFESTYLLGSENNDAMDKSGFSSNNAGGILGGISTGQDIVLRAAVKPTSSILKEQKTINTKGEEVALKVEGRHDPCICPRVVPVIESMVALVIFDKISMQTRIKSSNKKILEIIDQEIELLKKEKKELSK